MSERASGPASRLGCRLRTRAQPVRGQGSAHLVEMSLEVEARSLLRPGAADVGSLGREVVMNVEQLRKQAKELLKGARAGDPEALTRLGGREPILARAKLAVAREHGYAS